MGGVPGVRFLPNAITVLALCSGLTAVAFAMNGQWRLAVGAIAAAAVLDSLDGPAARLLNTAAFSTTAMSFAAGTRPLRAKNLTGKEPDGQRTAD